MIVVRGLPILPENGSWLGLEPGPASSEAKLQERSKKLAIFVVPLLLSQLSRHLFVVCQLVGQALPPTSTPRAPSACNLLLMAVCAFAAIVWLRSIRCNNSTQRRHLQYLVLAIYLGPVPITASVFDSVDMRDVLLVITRRFLAVFVLALYQVYLFGHVSLSSLLLALPGLMIYLVRCCISWIADSEVAKLRADIPVLQLHATVPTFLFLLAGVLGPIPACLLIARLAPAKIANSSQPNPTALGVTDGLSSVIPNLCLDVRRDVLSTSPCSDVCHELISGGALEAAVANAATDTDMSVVSFEVLETSPHATIAIEDSPIPQPHAVADLQAVADPPAQDAHRSDTIISLGSNTESHVPSVLVSLAREVVALSCSDSTAALQVLQNVGLGIEMDTVTSFDGISGAPNDNVNVPPLSSVVNFEGAWELIDEGNSAGVWIRSFTITGRTYLGGDGSEGGLRLRSNDAAILLEGGALRFEDDGRILNRIGKKGHILRFQRFVVPSTAVIASLQGIWTLLMCVGRSWIYRAVSGLSTHISIS